MEPGREDASNFFGEGVSGIALSFPGLVPENGKKRLLQAFDAMPVPRWPAQSVREVHLKKQKIDHCNDRQWRNSKQVLPVTNIEIRDISEEYFWDPQIVKERLENELRLHELIGR